MAQDGYDQFKKCCCIKINSNIKLLPKNARQTKLSTDLSTKRHLHLHLFSELFFLMRLRWPKPGSWNCYRLFIELKCLLNSFIVPNYVVTNWRGPSIALHIFPQGIEAWPMYDDTVFEWMAKIRGLRGTPWEGMGFQ